MDIKSLKLCRDALCLVLLGTVTAVQPLLAADTTPPSSAPVLFAEPLSPDKIQLSWTIPDDDVGISSYTVFRNGFKIAVTTAPAFLDIGLAADTVCDYTVTAWDKGNNPSPVSAAVRSRTFHAWDASQNLLACWQFNSSSGTIVYDSSPHHYDGQLVDSAAWGAGITGGAAVLNEPSGRVQRFPGSAFKYTGGDMTLSLWYYCDSTDTDGGYLLSKAWNGSGYYNYFIERTVTDKITFSIGGVDSTKFTTKGALTADEWNHILVTVSSDAAIRVYLNGYLEIDSSYTVSGWLPSGGDLDYSLVLGNVFPYGSPWAGDTKYNAKGRIDNVRVYDAALSPSQAEGIYYSEKRAGDAPGVFVASPKEGDTVIGTTPVIAEVLGEPAGVQFSVNGSSIGPVVTGPPYILPWNSGNVLNGAYRMTAAAVMADGPRVTMTSRQFFTVNNGDGVMVHVAPAISAVKILPDDTILPGTPSNTIAITATRGEYEPASFVLRSPSTALSSFTVTASPLLNGSRAIPTTNIDIKSVKVWYQSGSYAWTNITQSGGRIPVPVPELLLNDDALVSVDRVNRINYVRVNGSTVSVSDLSISTSGSEGNYSFAEFPVRDADTLQPMDIPKEETHQFWITVHIPDDAPSGTYAGTLTLQADGGFHRSLTLQVEVPEFDLKESSITCNLYYRGVLDPANANIGCIYKTEEQYRAELLDMKKHGVTDPPSYQTQQGTAFLQELSIRRELGMNKGPFYSLGGPVRATAGYSFAALDAAVPPLIDLVRSYGYTGLYVYASDEATGDALTAERPVIEHIQSLGGKVYVAGFDDAFARLGDLLDMIVLNGRTSSDAANDWHGAGKKIACYDNPQVGAENPFLYRRNFGVALWAAGYDAAFDFAYQWNIGLPWNDFDSETFRDHMFTYPTVNGVIDTIAWEGYREAHDDVRYLATLEAAIVQGAASGDSAKAAAANSAAAWLATLRQQTITNIGTGSKTADFAIDLDAMRSSIIVQIRAINNAHASPGDTTAGNGSASSVPAVYPVPFKGSRDRKLTFVNLQGSAAIDIYTLDRNRVYHEETENATYELIPSRLSSGVYVYVIKDGHGTKKGKLVIIR